MIDKYAEILNRYLIHCWIFCGIPVLISVIWIFVEIKRKKFDKTSLCLVFVGVVFLFVGLSHTVNVRLDINQNSVETVYFDNSKYYYDDGDSSFFTFAQEVIIYDTDGKSHSLYCRDDIFPYEAKSGKIVYATHTKMILEYNE